jgi:uncharacterized membrane protein YedE/YeeE
VPYGTGAVTGQVQPSKGLSRAMVILFWCTTAASALLGFALFSRKGVWDDFVSGKSSLSKLDDADKFAGLAVILQYALLLASAIVCCLWSKRIAENARARGVTGVSPGLAAGGWFIPIGNLFVGFDQLRKSATGVGGRSPSLGIWQALFIGQGVIAILIRAFGNFSVNNPGGVSDKLRNQGLIGIVGALIYAAATVFATRAAKEIDTAVTGA